MKKSAHPINDKAGAPGQGTTIVSGITRASFPPKVAGVTAEVLARLLRGERLTGLDAVTESSTTRLAAVIGYLGKAYSWTIDREDKAAGCCDGRLAYITEYWLGDEAIVRSMKAGAAAWCAVVWQARRQLRMKAHEARAAAVRANTARRDGHRQGLGGLLEAEGVNE